MPFSGAAVAYATVGGLILYSGIKGATISATVKGVLAGNLNVAGTQGINSGTSTTSATGPANVVSGSANQNYLTIANYLVGNGYSKAAAAGICGCIAGESAGDPEAIGDQGTSFGLIQEHGSQYSGLVTGNRSADLSAQLSAILAYNNAQGQGLIQMLNSISDPVQAAQFYSQHFERPQVTNSDVRPAVATSVYAAITSNASGTASQNGYTSPNGYSY